MDRGGKHLSREERAVIFCEDIRGSSQRQIGRLLGRSASTICRELARGRERSAGSRDGVASYSAAHGQRVYERRRRRCRRQRKLLQSWKTWCFVRDHLVKLRWSPEQIAAKLRLMHPDDPPMIKGPA